MQYTNRTHGTDDLILDSMNNAKAPPTTKALLPRSRLADARVQKRRYCRPPHFILSDLHSRDP